MNNQSTTAMQEGIVPARINGIVSRCGYKGSQELSFYNLVMKQITLKFINMSQIHRYTDNQQIGNVAKQSSFI